MNPDEAGIKTYKLAQLIYYMMILYHKQAGSELCKAQFKPGLANPASSNTLERNWVSVRC